MEKILFKSEERKELGEVSSFLRQLADKIDQNQVVLRKGTEEVTLDIPRNVVLELKVEEKIKRDKTKRKLEVEIEWIEGDQSEGVTEGVTLA